MADPSPPVLTYRKRRTVELVLILIAQAIGFAGYLLIHVNQDAQLPAGWPLAAAAWFGLGIATHLVVRFRLPYADPVLVPVTFLLTGLGLAMIHRIDLIPTPPRSDATTQFAFVVLGVVCFALIAFLLRNHRRLQVYPYLLFAVGLVLMLLPLVPGLGVELYGARIWISVFGHSFQPAEVAKIVLALAFAGYLTEKRDVLALAGRRVLGVDLPRARDLGPIATMWILSLLIVVFQKDLGTAMLFYGLFVVLIYVATEKTGWAVVGAGLLVVGAWFLYQEFAHVQRRVSGWLHPFADFDRNLQIINAQFGIAWGGMFGTGWGLGRPGLVPLAKSDFIAAAIGEELGIVGLMAVIVAYGLLVFRGLKAALAAHDPFTKLLATGLSFGLGLQVFAIIGGVTRLLPLTGLTTPFMSQGGSSMIANWIVVGLLMVISHQVRRPAVAMVPVDSAGVAELAGDETQVISARQLVAVSAGRDGAQVPDETGPAAQYDTDMEATQFVRVPAAADAEATQVVSAPPGSDDSATQVVPAPGGTDDSATQAVPAPGGTDDSGRGGRPAPGDPDDPTQLIAEEPR